MTVPWTIYIYQKSVVSELSCELREALKRFLDFISI